MKVTECLDCGVEMVPQKARRRDPLLRNRYAAHKARGLCERCYDRRSYRDDLIDVARASMTRDEVLDEWVILRGEGYTAVQAAPRLGMTVAAFTRALERARRDGDPRARFDWRGYHRARREAAS